MLVFSSLQKRVIGVCFLGLLMGILSAVSERNINYFLAGMFIFLVSFLPAIRLSQHRKVQFILHFLSPTLLICSLAVYFFYLKYYGLMALMIIGWGGLLVFVGFLEWKLHYIEND